MTLQELYSLYYIKQEIEDFKLKIIELREQAESITPKYSDAPSGGGCSDKVGNAVATIAVYEDMLADAITRKTEQAMKITEYILSIDDPQLRRIMYLRFIEHLSWRAIAERIGGGNTEDGVRKRCNRYVRKFESKKIA